MRDIPESLATKLASRETTLCTCWLITPRFGSQLGFTDHDRNLTFDGVEYEASSGFEASGVERELGLSIDNATATGALQSDRITEKDILKGRFDGATIEQWLVDWAATEDRLLTFKGEVGDITRSGALFEVELRGLSEKLNRSFGRKFLHICDAELGDERCGVDLANTLFRVTTTVVEPRSARSFICLDAGALGDGDFASGRLQWSSGLNTGQASTIRSATRQSDGVLVEVDRDLIDLPALGDAFSATVGCDRRKDSCANKFNNLNNFRGFPYMPGETWLTAYPVQGDVHDGGSQSGG